MAAGPPVHDRPYEARFPTSRDLGARAAKARARTSTGGLSLDEFKQAQREMWSLGDYPRMARDLYTPLGQRLVAACGIHQGQHVLDIAAGAGNVAVRAASTGAHVIAADLTPSLFRAGQVEAGARRVALEWVEADAEDLPFDTAMFDTVVSCLGLIFAPRPRVAAREALRVCRPGGTVGLVSWTPTGTMAGFYAVLARYRPPPGPWLQPLLLWGDTDYLGQVFGRTVDWRRHDQEIRRVHRFAGPAEMCEYFRANFGPAMSTYAYVADDPARTAALDEDLLAFARSHARSTGRGDVHFDFEYLLSVGTVLA